MKQRKKRIIWENILAGNPGSYDPASIVTDPNGSYTGKPADPEEKPVQDADDL